MSDLTVEAIRDAIAGFGGLLREKDEEYWTVIEEAALAYADLLRTQEDEQPERR